MLPRSSCLVLCLLLPCSVVAAEPPDAKTISERARTHWAFQPVRRPSVPRVRDTTRLRTPVDAFLLSRLEADHLTFTPPAERLALLRRATLDLIGLPPTPEEQQAFLADSSPDAFVHVVDRLLASSGYGERWGRHWLDVARYADTNGYERDGDKPHSWRYRDQVIDSFNADQPFDRFIREQIAGDELPDTLARAQIATTFLRLGTWDDEPADAVVDRFDQLDDVLGVTATAFLAQTIRCARCHDHKFEPFSQKDYYRLLAVFTPLRRPQKGRADLDRPVGSPKELADYHQTLARHESERVRLEKAVDVLLSPVRRRVLEGAEGKLSSEARAAFRTEPSKRSKEEKLLVRRNQEQFDTEVEEAITPEEQTRIEEARRQLEAHLARVPRIPRAYVWYEEGPKAPPTFVLKRGNPHREGAEVQPGLPAVLSVRPVGEPGASVHSTGRRLWLANWIADRNNPLTARVIVNRVWQWHFGKGIVATANDFGLSGERPSHPELLDWLAAEFVEHGWSLKHLHRLIVLSSAYQTSSALASADERQRGDHPGHLLDLFGRWRQRRLEGEVVRDSILAVSGQLNRQAGGPGVYPTLAKAVLASQSRPGNGWGRSTPEQAARRSIYVFAKRSLLLPELELLDAPDNTSSCEQRSVSTTAPQALTLLNGDFSLDQARHFADRLRREAGKDPAAQVRRAFVLALGRPPRPEEVNKVIAFLTAQEKLIVGEGGLSGQTVDAGLQALRAFCLVLFNCNEFAYPG